MSEIKIKRETPEGFEYVPSINLYVSIEKEFLDENWQKTREIIEKSGDRIPTPWEFTQFLAYEKFKNPDFYKKTTEIKERWEGEFLDGFFKNVEKKLCIFYHMFDKEGKIKTKYEPIRETNTHERKNISIDDWIESSTHQGFPKWKIKEGNFRYWPPQDKYTKEKGAPCPPAKPLVGIFGSEVDGGVLNFQANQNYRYALVGARRVRFVGN